MFRKKKYQTGIYIFLLFAILSLVYVFTLNVGLNVETNVVYDNGSKIELTILNKSDHLISGIEIYNNELKVITLDSLDAKSEHIEYIDAISGYNNIKASAKYHLSYVKSVKVEDQSETETQSNFSYSVKYQTFVIGKGNDVDLKVCNNGNSMVLEIELEENEYITSENHHFQKLIPDKSCETITFYINPVKAGATNLNFKIFNDYYFNEFSENIDIK